MRAAVVVGDGGWSGLASCLSCFTLAEGCLSLCALSCPLPHMAALGLIR
mgnify:CR=1 FL=1